MKKLFNRFRKKTAQEPPSAPANSAPVASPGIPPMTPALRTSPAVVLPNMPSWHSTSAPAGAKKGTAPQLDRKTPVEMLTLTLGDFIPRIPPSVLDPGEHDLSTPLPFDLAALSERIGRGDSQIPLNEIYRRIPDVFRTDVVIAPEQMVRFPWSRVLTMVKDPGTPSSSSGLSPAGVETLSLKLKARKLRQTTNKAAPSLRPPTQTSPAMEALATPQPESLPTPVIGIAVEERTAQIDPKTALSNVSTPSAPSASESAPAVELKQHRAEQAQRLIELRAERDQLRAEVARQREELAGFAKQNELERQVAAEAGGKLASLEKDYAEVVQTLETLQAERDSALTRSAEFGAEHDSAIARTGELTAERDVAVARAAELLAEHDATGSRAAELTVACDAAAARITALTCERDTAQARVAELMAEQDLLQAGTAEFSAERALAHALRDEITAERDAALTRIAEVTGERDAALAQATAVSTERDTAEARAVELTLERDAAVTTAARQTSDSEAAVALVTELTAERDTIRARVTELESGNPIPAPTIDTRMTEAQGVWESRTAAQFESDIEGYRSRIQALLRERDLLRKEMADAAADRPVPDVYSELFPQNQWVPQTVLALLLVLAGFLFAKQFHRPSEPTSQIDASVPAPVTEVVASEPASASFSKEKLPLKSPSLAEPTELLLPDEELSAITAGLASFE